MADPATPIVLLADIGGTNSRFALAGSDGRPTRMLIIENDTVPNLEGAITRYLDETGARPSAAVLAVAAPLESEVVALTNRAWRFRPSELARRFGFAKLRLGNDFEAVRWALTRLTSGDAHPVGAVDTARPRGRAAHGVWRRRARTGRWSLACAGKRRRSRLVRSAHAGGSGHLRGAHARAWQHQRRDDPVGAGPAAAAACGRSALARQDARSGGR